MTRAVAHILLIAFVVVSVALVSARPDWVSDSNDFLKNFVNHEFVNILGVILAITLASAAQIHLAFNSIEERHKTRNALEGSRRELRSAAFALITIFIAGVIVVAIKPIASKNCATAAAIFNMAALFLLFWQVLLLISLTQLVFCIEPEFTDDDQSSRPKR